jgi:hypothetical protein
VSEAYRQAIDAQDFDRAHGTLAEDAVMFGPIAPEPYEGRDQVIAVLRSAVGLLRDFGCRHVVEGGNVDVVLFGGKLEDGTEVEFIDLIKTGPDGLVKEITVVARPLIHVFRWAQAAAPGEGKPSTPV